MSERMKKVSLALGAAMFFIAAPGLVAGLAPYLLTRGQSEARWPAHGFWMAVGAIMIAAGLVSLIEAFVRFVSKGRGTPAPMAPPEELVVSGQYRFVRNPMYVAVV